MLASASKPAAPVLSVMQYLGQWHLRAIGRLSSVTYHPRQDVYYLLTDDRSGDADTCRHAVDWHCRTTVLTAPSSSARGRCSTKRRAQDFTAALMPLDNIARITLGPALPDGRASVVLASQSHRPPHEITRLVAFALYHVPRRAQQDFDM